ncbi:putative membrane protein [Povalibacter uvarum]|uniref:Putative membrane protein n=1 Tax=Povalibacter uvarum TaxID=732238 RepID=A0A841HPI2_9GAMM|nr:heparan-alpha-glucosaminide N-acetyltransferase domain-containing protein [Povalibacter uvarum]MBB6094150.1 putative membrane protein [Povalibacter uvarum]
MSSTPFDATPMAADRHAASAVVHARTRLQSIDVVRGLVMVLMTLDHVRHYFTDARFDPLDPALTNGALYVTRWVTHLCAPTFVFLAGVSAFLMAQRMTPQELSRFLLTRGLWLVFLEFTIVNLSFTFDLGYANGIFFQVMWAIGASMVALAALIRLPVTAILAIGVAIVAGHNLLDGIAPSQFGTLAPLWNLLHAAGPVPFGFVAYPVLPWIGVMALGYVAGAVYRRDAATRQQMLIAGGCTALILFIALRLLNGYGDLDAWSVQPTFAQTLYSFFDVEKYPPSLLYILATLGIASLLLAAAERIEQGPAGGALQVLRTYGRVPLFFYVLHIVLAHLSAAVIGLVSGFGTEGLFVHSIFSLPEDWGFSLPMVYVAWLAVMIVSYPLCRWFCDLKQRRNDWWLSYL